jgi:hypothetical protein
MWELSQVRSLSSLTALRLASVFDEAWDEGMHELYTPPSRIMPSLKRFVYNP